MSRRRHTIVIAGAGPVGLAVACLLCRARGAGALRILIVDSGAPPHWDADKMDLRVYALSRASEELLRRLDAWDAVCRRRVSPYRRMHVWEQDARTSGLPPLAGTLEFDSADIGEPNLGHIVEDGLLRLALYERLVSERDVEFRWHQRVEQVAPEQRCIDVVTGDERFEATLLVAADGGRSAVRSLVGFALAERDYAQKAIVAHVTTQHAHRATARQRFLPGGPLAFLPLADGRSSIVWSLPVAAAEKLIAASDAEFLVALHDASAGALGEIRTVSERAALPLAARHVWRYCEQRVVLVGDAAHTVHPLAGLGMNLGLLDAAALGAVLESALRQDEDPGDRRVLRRYERARKGDNLGTLLALDALDRLFRLPRAAAPLRVAGFACLDRIPLLKRMLMARALGLAHAGPGAATGSVAAS
jgi:2-polyprenylphenol 6-hydroxylase